MTPTHTPKPWYTNSGQIIEEQTGKTIAHITLFDSDSETDKANARLIAASPEMYELLKQVQNYQHERFPYELQKDIANVLYNIDKP